MKHFSKRLTALALATCMAAPAVASKFVATSQSSSGTISLSGPTDYKSEVGADPRSVTTQSAVTQSAGGGTAVSTGRAGASAFAYALPGGLRLAASTSVELASSNGAAMSAQGNASAGASLDDAFVIVATSCQQLSVCGNGALGTLTFSIWTDGSLGGGGTGQYGVVGQWTADFSLTTGYLPSAPQPTSAAWHGDRYFTRGAGTPTIESGNGTLGLHSYTLSFAFGTPINLRFGATATSQSNVGYAFPEATAAFTTDLSHTFAWAGIQGVTDTLGQPVAFSAWSSGSGYDYAQPFTSAVPEPASALMLGGALMLLPWMARRRHR
ncbi:MAG: hypothetical protein ACT6S0_21595 [Roseateles sp.]|uniref:hypothetical protein n=1 Tax=Roseateles sp. TaxID=1971397 RepID=UPI0040355133